MTFLGLTPAWITNSFPIIRYVLMFIIAAAAITLIVVVMMQESQEGGSNAVTGAQESYYSQNKGKTKEGVLKKLTIAMSSIIAISIILFFVTLLVVPA